VCVYAVIFSFIVARKYIIHCVWPSFTRLSPDPIYDRGKSVLTHAHHYTRRVYIMYIIHMRCVCVCVLS